MPHNFFLEYRQGFIGIGRQDAFTTLVTEGYFRLNNTNPKDISEIVTNFIGRINQGIVFHKSDSLLTAHNLHKQNCICFALKPSISQLINTENTNTIFIKLTHSECNQLQLQHPGYRFQIGLMGISNKLSQKDSQSLLSKAIRVINEQNKGLITAINSYKFNIFNNINTQFLSITKDGTRNEWQYFEKLSKDLVPKYKFLFSGTNSDCLNINDGVMVVFKNINSQNTETKKSDDSLNTLQLTNAKPVALFYKYKANSNYNSSSHDELMKIELDCKNRDYFVCIASQVCSCDGCGGFVFQTQVDNYYYFK